jgi:hypothetical protein
VIRFDLRRDRRLDLIHLHRLGSASYRLGSAHHRLGFAYCRLSSAYHKLGSVKSSALIARFTLLARSSI